MFRLPQMHVHHAWNLLFIFLILRLPDISYAKDCRKIDDCSCEFDDGSGTMDLTNLGKQTGPPLFSDQAGYDGYQYSFNPCYQFNEGTCTNVAGCQVDSYANPPLYYDIGAANDVAFFFDGANVIGTYLSGDYARTSVVTYICDPSATMPSVEVIGESPPGTPTYEFKITSSECCPKQEPPKTRGSPTDGPSGQITVTAEISTGTILSIVFFAIIIVYLISGTLFNKLYRKESGRGVIPNVTFWTLLPGLIKDGFGFTVAKIRRKEYQAI